MLMPLTTTDYPTVVLRLLLQREAGADPEQDDAEHAPPPDTDPIRAQEAVAVDRRTGRELPCEEDRDGRDHADARAGDRDREHDDHAHHRAAPEPDRLPRRVCEGAQAL